MGQFVLPHPWWVNAAAVVPIFTFYFFRKNPPYLSIGQLINASMFSVAFAFVEASVVIYLRAITGVASGNSLPEIANFASAFYHEARMVPSFPASLFIIELVREVSTIIMLVSIALLTTRGLKERWAIFLWSFAVWDVFYYLWLRITLGWPTSLKSLDILFLIPTPWISQVWFPLIVSVSTLLIIVLTTTGLVARKDSAT